MKGKLGLLLGMFLLSLAACEEKPCGCEETGAAPVYFEYHYRNWAWGYQDHGWLIDREGVVRHFSMPEGFREADSLGLITAADLEYNLGQCDSTLQVVDMQELRGKVALIPGAADGEIGEARNIAADAGSSVLSAFVYLEDEDRYQKVFLGMSGDWEQENLSAEAGELVEWLLDFGVFWLSE